MDHELERRYGLVRAAMAEISTKGSVLLDSPFQNAPKPIGCRVARVGDGRPFRRSGCFERGEPGAARDTDRRAGADRRRVAEFLVALCPVDAGPCVVALPYDKETIAGRLGLRPESLSRAFGRLKSKPRMYPTRRFLAT